jgi:hypothetical protein
MKKFMLLAGLVTPILFSPFSVAEITYNVSCASGNFKGEAEITSDSNESTGGFEVKVNKYKITKSEGQSGGNKANVNLKATYGWNESVKKLEDKSSDSMQQDGKWHNLSLEVGGVRIPHWNMLRSEVEFVFDKSGSDPRCTAQIY